MNIFFYIWENFLIIYVRYNLYTYDRNQTFDLYQSLLRHCNFTINDCTNSCDVIFLLFIYGQAFNRFTGREISNIRKIVLISLYVYIFFFNIIS